MNCERQEVTRPSSRRQVCGLKLVFGREVGGFQVSHLPHGFFAFILKQVTLGECRLIDTHL